MRKVCFRAAPFQCIAFDTGFRSSDVVGSGCCVCVRFEVVVQMFLIGIFVLDCHMWNQGVLEHVIGSDPFGRMLILQELFGLRPESASDSQCHKLASGRRMRRNGSDRRVPFGFRRRSSLDLIGHLVDCHVFYFASLFGSPLALECNGTGSG